MECTGPTDSLTNLRFRYTGGNCNGLEGCADRNEGPNGLEEVFITVSDREFGDYFAGVITLEDFIDVSNPIGFSGEDLVIEIETVDINDKGENRGDRLQSVDISVLCNLAGQNAIIVLGNEFGGVTLTAFTSKDEDVGEQSLFVTVQMTYTIENPAVFDAFLNSAILSSFFSGPGQQLITSPQRIDKRENLNLLTEETLLDLREAVLQPAYVFGLDIRGEAINSGGGDCDDFPVFFFSVTPAPA
jgi:hypothetical protein